jgi:hypothetical protein
LKSSSQDDPKKNTHKLTRGGAATPSSGSEDGSQNPGFGRVQIVDAGWSSHPIKRKRRWASKPGLP